MTNHEKHKWIFSARFRTGAYSWKASRKVCQRLREAVSEIKKVAKKDPVLGAEGAVRLMEKLWPALEHIDTSSGALGSAVYKTLDTLIPIIVKAPADEKTRNKWLDRLWQAMEDDGVDYLSPVVGDRNKSQILADLIATRRREKRASGSPQPRSSSVMIWRWSSRTGLPVIRER